MSQTQRETPKVPEPARGNGRGPLGEMPADLAALGRVPGAGEKLPTLAEVGRRLPIGYVDAAGARHREFDLVPWDWDLEDRLGELAADEPDMRMPAYVAEVLGAGLARLGALEFPKLSRAERRLLIRSMHVPDVFFAYVWVRVGALGRVVVFRDFQCSVCRKSVPEFRGDLGTLEVKASEEVPRRVVKLAHGVEFAGKRLTTFTLQPLRWAHVESQGEREMRNAARSKLAMIQQGVAGLEGAPEGPVYLTETHLRTMEMVEVNRLVREIDDLGGGLVMEFSGRCPHGAHDFRRGIDWGFGDFFQNSSP